MFGEYLIGMGVISDQQLQEGLKVQKGIGKPLGETLVFLGYLDKPELEMHLQQHLLVVADSVLADPELQAVAE